MAKKINKNHEDFIKFAKQNKNLTRTEIYWKYREQGGKIKKQTALDLLRELTKVDKRKERGKTVEKLIKEKRTRQKIKVVDKDFKSLESPIIQKLFDNIQKLYGSNEDQKKFLKVGITNNHDEYSQIKEFNIFIPTDKDQMGVRTLSNEIIKNMKTYYKNLAKMYSNKNNMAGSTLTKLSGLTKDLKSINDLTREEMERSFLKYGFELKGYEIFEFRETDL